MKKDRKKKKRLKNLGFKVAYPPSNRTTLKKLQWALPQNKLPKDAPDDIGVPTGHGSDYDVVKTDGGFEVF